MSVNNGKQLNFKYSINNSIDNKDNKENEYNEFFLKNNSLCQNYGHMINLNNLNNYNNSQTIIILVILIILCIKILKHLIMELKI